MKKLITLALLSSAATARMTATEIQAEVKAQESVLSGINSQVAVMMQPIRAQAKEAQAEISAPINAQVESLTAQMKDVGNQIRALYMQKGEMQDAFTQEKMTLEEAFKATLKATLDPMVKELEARRAPILESAKEIKRLQDAERKRLWSVWGPQWMSEATPGEETMQMREWSAEYEALFAVDGDLPAQIQATERAMKDDHSARMSDARASFYESMKPCEAAIEELRSIENSLSAQILELTKQRSAMINEAMPHLGTLLDGIQDQLVSEIISAI